MIEKIVDVDLDSYVVFGLAILFALATYARVVGSLPLAIITFVLLVMWGIGLWLMTVCAIIYFFSLCKK